MEEPLPEGDFSEVLQNGVILCKLMNKLAPGSVKKFKEKVRRRKRSFFMSREGFTKTVKIFLISKIDSQHIQHLVNVYHIVTVNVNPFVSHRLFLRIDFPFFQ